MSLTKERVKSIIYYAVKNLLGEQGLIEVSPRVLYFNGKSNEAIVRCTHSSMNKLRASLALVTESNDHSISIIVMRVSGTMKSLKEELRIL